MNYKISTMLIIVIVCFLSGCTNGTNEVSINNKPKSETVEKSNNKNSAKTEGNESDTLDLNKFDITNGEDNKSGIIIIPTTTGESSELRFKKFTGTHTMMKITMKENQSIELKYACKIESGKFNILIQDEKYNIVQQINDNEEKGTITLKATQTGDYIIRAVGDEASEGKVIINFK